jgi:hypothetical protein
MKLILASLLILLSVSCAVAAPNTCTSQKAMAAESDTDHLSSWPRVYESYRKYRDCDDGSIGEGYSDKICRLLAYKWDQAPVLNKLAHESRDFEKFVIKHIDDTVDLNDLKMIFANATRSCFPGGKALCKKITKSLCEGQKEVNREPGAPKWGLISEKQYREFCP